MQRDLDALTGRRFDLLVVGGGIHGLFSAYEAASRGLSVALVEASDFGGGASWNHQRTLHGGLRALQTGNLLKTRQQIAERRTWAVIAPHFVRPLPFLVGTYRGSKRSRTLMRAGFALYDWLGRDRNVGVSPELHLPRTRLESRATTRGLFPGIHETGLTGGAAWYDYQIRNPERLTWCVALAAAQAGASLANHVEAIGPLRSAGRVTGCRVRDAIGGGTRDIEARVTLLAVGSHLEPLQTVFEVTGAPRVLRAINVLVDRPARDIALGAASASGRMLTAVPWAGHVLIGTHQSTTPVDPAETTPPESFVAELVAEANSAFPALQLSTGDVRLVHYGLTPAAMRGGRAELMADPLVTRHRTQGVAGLISLVGVKYTTARFAASLAIDAVAAELGTRLGASRSARAPLPHAGVADTEGRLLERLRHLDADLAPDVVDHLASWYGTEAPDVVSHAAEANGLTRLHAGTPVLAGEVTYAATRGAAPLLSDVLLRRTALASAGHPGAAVVRAAAALMAPLAGWSPAAIEDEIASIDRLLRVSVH